jgi:hypothetical protein
MKNIINFSSKNLVRVGALICIVSFMFLSGCNDKDPSCEITVSGSGSVCQIQYSDADGVMHNIIVQSDSDIVTIDDCDEVMSVDCS